jgi:outer membrane protein
MKSLLYILLAVPTVCQAQTSAGSFLAGGNMSFRTQTQNTTYTFFWFGGPVDQEAEIQTNSFSVSPSGGYFIIDNLCAGMSFPVQLSKSTTKIDDDILINHKSTTRTLTFGPFARYYFPLHDKISLLVFANYAWGYSRTRTESTTAQNGVVETSKSETKFRSDYFNTSGGASFFPNKNTGLEFLLQYGILTYDEIPGDIRGLTASIGLQIYFTK